MLERQPVRLNHPLPSRVVQSITQDTTLTRDLEDCTDGLEVAGTGITLDLGGHTISGTGTAGIGVHITGDEVTIENGKITNFGTGVSSGVFLQRGPIFHLRRLKAVENGAGVAAFSSNPFATAPSTIEASEIGRNTGSGMFFDGIYLIVTDSAFRRNGLVGIDQGEAAAVYERNNISNNGGNGIQTLTPYSMSLIGNTLNGNGGSGLDWVQNRADSDAFPHLANNTANRNAQLGLSIFNGSALPVTWDDLDGGGNIAANNGDPRQCVVEARFTVIPRDALVCKKTFTR